MPTPSLHAGGAAIPTPAELQAHKIHLDMANQAQRAQGFAWIRGSHWLDTARSDRDLPEPFPKPRSGIVQPELNPCSALRARGAGASTAGARPATARAQGRSRDWNTNPGLGLRAGNGTIHPAWPWADSKHWALNHPNNKDLGVQGGPRRRCWVLQPQGMVEEAEKASLNLERSCLAPGLGQHLVTNAVIVTVTPC